MVQLPEFRPSVSLVAIKASVLRDSTTSVWPAIAVRFTATAFPCISANLIDNNLFSSIFGGKTFACRAKLSTQVPHKWNALTGGCLAAYLHNPEAERREVVVRCWYLACVHTSPPPPSISRFHCENARLSRGITTKQPKLNEYVTSVCFRTASMRRPEILIPTKDLIQFTCPDSDSFACGTGCCDSRLDWCDYWYLCFRLKSWWRVFTFSAFSLKRFSCWWNRDSPSLERPLLCACCYFLASTPRHSLAHSRTSRRRYDVVFFLCA